MMAILTAISEGRCDAEVAVVISHNPQAAGLKSAQDAGIPTHVFSISDFDTKTAYEEAVSRCLQDYEVGLVILAGYMRLVGQPLLTTFPNQILNIHPSLLPLFKGLNAQRQALEAGVSESGCTVHLVDESLDGGPILLQETVPVYPQDTEEALSERILVKEHRLYAKTIDLVIKGQLPKTS